MEILKKYRNLIKSTAYKYSRPHISANFLEAQINENIWNKLNTFDPDIGEEVTWVRQIAESACMDVLRKMSIPFDDLPDYIGESPYTADRELLDCERVNFLKEVLSELTLKEQYILKSKFGLDEFPETQDTQVAHDLCIDYYNYTVILKRLLEKLRNNKVLRTLYFGR